MAMAYTYNWYFFNLKVNPLWLSLDRYSKSITIRWMQSPHCWGNHFKNAFNFQWSLVSQKNCTVTEAGITLLTCLLILWKILMSTLTFSSSYHHSPNPVEQAVWTAKNIMKKCAETNGNWWLGLLEYLCIPISESFGLPAELLNSCMYKGILPYAFPRHNQNDQNAGSTMQLHWTKQSSSW